MSPAPSVAFINRSDGGVPKLHVAAFMPGCCTKAWLPLTILVILLPWGGSKPR